MRSNRLARKMEKLLTVSFSPLKPKIAAQMGTAQVKTTPVIITISTSTKFKRLPVRSGEKEAQPKTVALKKSS